MAGKEFQLKTTPQPMKAQPSRRRKRRNGPKNQFLMHKPEPAGSKKTGNKEELPGSGKKNESGMGHEHDVCILDRKIKNQLREPKDAWGIVLENMGLAENIIERHGLRGLVKKSHWQDVWRIAVCSLFNSALSWDASKSVFSTYAVDCGKECQKWVLLLDSAIWVNKEHSGRVCKFRKKKAENPGLTFARYVETTGLGRAKARTLRATLMAMEANKWPIDISAIPGEAGYGGKGPGNRPKVSRRHNTALVHNSCDLHRKMEKEVDMQKAARRLREIILEVLDERKSRIMLLRSGILTGEMPSFDEVGEALGISRSRAQQLFSEGEKELAKCDYKEELREFYEASIHYSQQ